MLEIFFNISGAQDLKGGGIPYKINGMLIVNLERNPLGDFTASAVKIEYIGLLVQRVIGHVNDAEQGRNKCP